MASPDTLGGVYGELKTLPMHALLGYQARKQQQIKRLESDLDDARLDLAAYDREVQRRRDLQKGI